MLSVNDRDGSLPPGFVDDVRSVHIRLGIALMRVE